MIRFNFDHHQCTDCGAEHRAHRIAARLVQGQYFWFCTGCGFEEGPYATLPSGERGAVGERGADSVEEVDALTAAEIEQDVIAGLVDELSDRFGVHDREGLAAAIGEARAIREAARAAEPGSPAVVHLTQIVDRAETLIGERDEINATLRDLFAFAKDIGFNVKAIRACIAARAILPELRKIQEAEVKVYRDALGIEGPEFAVTMPVPMLEAARPRAVPKKVQARRDSVALAHLAEMARSS